MCAYRVTPFERGEDAFDHASILSLFLFLFFLEDERGGRLFPSQVFARGKDSKGRGGEGRKKRGKEETTRDFLHTIRITGSLEHRVSFAFPFELSYSFRLPLFPPSSLFFPFPPLERNKNNGERFLGPEEPQRKAADDAGRSILAQKEEREIKEERKKEKIL